MKQWDIFMYDFPQAGMHPAVILSHPDRVERKELVNVLLCGSHRLNRPLKPYEVMLDEADGLDWQTTVRCDVMYALEKSRLSNRRGCVIPVRRRAIVERIVSAFAFNQV